MGHAKVVLACLLVLTALPAWATSYSTIALPFTTSARVMNDAGHIAYAASATDGKHVYLWKVESGITDLGLVANASVIGMNDLDQILIGITGGASCILTPGSGLTPLPASFRPAAINNAGHAAGSLTDAQGIVRGYFWTAEGGLQDMGDLGAGSSTGGTALNDADKVVGASTSLATYMRHAFLWSRGSSMADLGTLPGEYLESRATAINDANQVAGYSYTSISGNMARHAFLWSPSSGMQDISSPSADGDGDQAIDLNDSGQVIIGNGSGDLLWQAGTRTSIASLFSNPPLTCSAYVINDSGWILGSANNAPFLLIPSPLLDGDANSDGKVNFADYLALEANFRKTGATWAQGDFTRNGTVDFADYLAMEANFGKHIPEPATLCLLAAGAGALIRRRQ